MPDELPAPSPFKARLAAALIRGVSKILELTCRVTFVEGRDLWKALGPDSPQYILCAWHNRVVFLSTRFKRLTKRGFKLAMMSSLSKDGAIGAIIGEKIGATVVRGSSSRGGTAGLRALYRAAAKQKCSIIILPDGSQGPIYQAKPGAVALAQMTGCAMLPVSYWAKHYWRAGSWDKMIVPKPFSKIAIAVGQPIHVPRDAKDEALEAARLQLQSELDRLGRVCEVAMGKVPKGEKPRMDANGC